VTVPFGGGVTIMLVLSPVPFRGKENMTVQERVKFIILFRFFPSGALSVASTNTRLAEL